VQLEGKIILDHVSVKGYDEVIPELLNVVLESRKYRIPEDFEGIFFKNHNMQGYYL
jgi:NAD-dependent DNA ligase